MGLTGSVTRLRPTPNGLPRPGESEVTLFTFSLLYNLIIHIVFNRHPRYHTQPLRYSPLGFRRRCRARFVFHQRSSCRRSCSPHLRPSWCSTCRSPLSLREILEELSLQVLKLWRGWRCVDRWCEEEIVITLRR